MSELLSKRKRYPSGEHEQHLRGLLFEWDGQFRRPVAGQWYLSGAVICAYLASNDLQTSYYTARQVAERRTGDRRGDHARRAVTTILALAGLTLGGCGGGSDPLGPTVDPNAGHTNTGPVHCSASSANCV